MRSQKYILLLKWLKHRESARTCAASTVADEVFACVEETSTAEVKKTRHIREEAEVILVRWL